MKRSLVFLPASTWGANGQDTMLSVSGIVPRGYYCVEISSHSWREQLSSELCIILLGAIDENRQMIRELDTSEESSINPLCRYTTSMFHSFSGYGD